MDFQLKNKVVLLNWTGGDEAHAMAAWASTNTELTEDKKKRIPDLLLLLASKGHTSPFEHSQITFRVTSEIASHIQFIRHRVGVSFNVESARYKELKDDKYYTPIDWPTHERLLLQEHCESCFSKYHKVIKRLIDAGFSRSRAKESARLYLPYANQLNFIVTFNYRSFVHFFNLRAKPDAQYEIREIAKEMGKLIKDIPTAPFEHSIKAFGLEI